MLLLLACSSPGEAVDDDPRFVGLLDWASARMSEWSIPGAAIVVVEGGRTHVAGLGVKEFGNPAEVSPDTLFRAGSVSKMIAGSRAAQLAADGALDLDAPASALLDDLALASGSFDDFTLLNLASHTSGMQTGGLPNACDTDPDHLGDVFAELTPEWSLWTEPDEIFNYANQGFGLLGLASERASGERYVDLAQQTFDAAGMSTATYDWEVATASDHATGHTMNLVTGEPLSYRTLDERACVASYPSGGMMLSARDLGKLAEMLLDQGGAWMTPAGWDVFTTEGYNRSETGGYGFGIGGADYRGYAGYTHHGSLGGYFAMLWVIPSENLGVGVLVNSDHFVTDPPAPWAKPTQRFMQRALDTFLGLETEEIVSSVRPVEEWSRFIGTWHSDFEMGDVAVSFDGEQLWLNAPALGVVASLYPYSASSFQYSYPKSDGRTGWDGVSFGSRDDRYEYLLMGAGVGRWSGE